MTVQKSAFILIEFQHEWLDETGKLNRMMQDRQQFDDSIEQAKIMLLAVRSSTNVAIVHVPMQLTLGYPELGKATTGLRAAIQRAGTWTGIGREFVEPFVPKAGEFVVQGRVGASAFAGSNLDAYLRHNGINKLYLAGYALHVCVESTLRHGHDLGYTVTVVGDACSAFNQRQRQQVLEDIVHHFGQRLTGNEFLQQIKTKLEVALSQRE